MNSFILIAAIALFFVAGSNGQNGTKTVTVTRPVEIVLLVDMSGSIDPPDYEKMIDEVRKIPDRIDMGPQKARVAVIRFGSAVEVLFNLTDDANLVRQTPNTRPARQATNTTGGLKDAKNLVLTNARSGAATVIIVITDGMPKVAFKDDSLNTEQAAEDARAAGITIFSAYIGAADTNATIRDHLNKVTGDPSHVFPLKDFDQLANGLSAILQKVECIYDRVCYFKSGTCKGECDVFLCRINL